MFGINRKKQQIPPSGATTDAPEMEPRHDQQQPPEPLPEPTDDLASAAQEEPTQPWTDQLSAWLTPTRVLVAAASVPSLLSLIWLASTVAEITAGPGGEITAAGLATGVFADVLIVSAVLIGWFFPAVRNQASIGGWVAALAASALLGWHHWGSEQALFALVPLGAKFLWHLGLMSQTADETAQQEEAARRAEAERVQREQADQAAEQARIREEEEASANDDSLTVEQRREIAGLRREAAFAKAKATAQAERAEAEIAAENTVDMATDRAEAERLRNRYELAAQVGGRLPIQVLAQFLPDLPGVEVSEVRGDRSQIGPAPDSEGTPAPAAAGFGAALAAMGGGNGGTGREQAVSGLAETATEVGGTGPHHIARRAAGAATRQRVLEAITAQGTQVKTSVLARELGLSRTTVREHRKALAEAGHEVFAHEDTTDQ